MSVVNGVEEEVLKMRVQAFGRHAKLRLLYKMTTGVKSNAGVHASIDGKGATFHVIVTPQGMLGAFAKRSFANAGGAQADSESFLWRMRDGEFRKFPANGSTNHIHFSGPVIFGFNSITTTTTIRHFFGRRVASTTAISHAFVLDLDNMASSHVKALPAVFSGFSDASDLNPVTNPLPVVDYMVFSVSDEDEYIDRFDVAREWGSEARDKLLREVKEFRPYAPSIANSSDQVLNVLTVGERGTGKSSFHNAMMSTLRQCPTEILHAAPSAGDVTTQQTNVSLEPFSVKMGIRDVPGWTSVADWSLYMRLLKCIVSGRTRDLDNLLPVTEDLLRSLEARPEPPFDQRIHCIVVLKSAEDDRPAVVEKLRSVVKEFDHVVPVMALLTKVDVQLPDTATLQNVYAVDDFSTARLQLAREAALDANRILPMATYGGDIDYPNVNVEIMVLTALQKAQALAEKALQMYGRM